MRVAMMHTAAIATAPDGMPNVERGTRRRSFLHPARAVAETSGDPIQRVLYEMMTKRGERPPMVNRTRR